MFTSRAWKGSYLCLLHNKLTRVVSVFFVLTIFCRFLRFQCRNCPRITNVVPILFFFMRESMRAILQSSSGSFTSYDKTPTFMSHCERLLRGPMTIWAWLDLRAAIGKVVKILKISFENFLGKVRNIFGSHGFS